MERLRNFQLMDGVDSSLEIRQYMDLDYVLRLLETRSYFVKWKKCFQDRHESRLPIKAMFRIQPVGCGCNNGSNNENAIDIAKDLDKIKKFTESGCMLTACWTERKGESALMWQNFTTKMGACIKSTIHNFIASFEGDDYEIRCGRMSYTGISAGQDLLESLFTKDQAFKEEKEIRFYFIPKVSLAPCEKVKNAQIRVLPDVMIDEIMLSPYIDPKAQDILKQVISEKYNIKVTSSKMEIK